MYSEAYNYNVKGNILYLGARSLIVVCCRPVEEVLSLACGQ